MSAAVPPRPASLFFALRPEAAVRDALRARADAVQARHAIRGRRVDPRRYHITLRFLGRRTAFPSDWLQGLLAAGDAVRSERFELILDRVGGFPGSRVGWLGPARVPEPLARLHDRLEAVLAGAGPAPAAEPAIEPDRVPYRPHVTVWRELRGRMPATTVEPVSWTVDSFALLLSRPPDPYECLRTWPLATAEPRRPDDPISP